MESFSVGNKIMNKYHKIEKVAFKEGKLILGVDGREYIFLLADISKRLAHASQNEREKYQISPSGYGIHWPLIDEDLSVDSLLGIEHKSNKLKQVTAIQTER